MSEKPDMRPAYSFALEFLTGAALAFGLVASIYVFGIVLAPYVTR